MEKVRAGRPQFVVVHVLTDSAARLPQVADAAGLIRSAPGRSQRSQQDADKYAEDTYDDQQLNQR
jgi:hypothetical protein